MNKVVVSLAAILVLSACGSDSEPSQAPTQQTQPAATASPTKTSAPADSPVQISVEIKDGTATPQGKRVDVRVGQRVSVNVSSDADDEIHVHSDPEHTIDVKAGATASKTFTIDRPGQVAVESHHLGVTLVQLVVRP